MSGLNLFVILKVIGIIVGGLAGFLGTVTRTHRETDWERKLTGWGWTCAVFIVLGTGLAGTSQILDSRQQANAAEEQTRQKLEERRLDTKKDVEYREQIDRILAGQNAAIQKQAQANVASKLKLIEPDNQGWLSDTNAIAKKRLDIAKSEADRIAKEVEEQSRKSKQVYEDLLFAVEFTKKRAQEIQIVTGDEIDIPTNSMPDNLCSTSFQSLIEFKKSKAVWNVYTRTDALVANEGFPWLSIDFSDYHGSRSGGVNLQTKPLEDSFRISYEEKGKVLIDKSGKLTDFQAAARKVIEQALQAQYIFTAPLPENLK